MNSLWQHTLLGEVRYAARRLRRSPGFTAVVAITLALGIGANAAIFSVVNALLLRPLPYPEAERLVAINHFYPSYDNLEASVSPAGFRTYTERVRSFDLLAVQSWWQVTLTGTGGDPEQLMGSQVSRDFFRVYGVGPAMGRAFLPEEDEPGAARVVLLSDGLWRRSFGADPGVLGRTVQLNGHPHEIVGVMPEGFEDFFHPGAELWAPLALTPAQFAGSPTNEWLTLTARLAAGATLEAAQRELAALAEQLKAEDTGAYPQDWSLKATPIAEKLRGGIRPLLLVLMGAVAFVLLIACINVANLLLARGLGRRKEVAVRTALGAARGQLVRQFLVESVVLALLGGALGALLAAAGVGIVRGVVPADLPGASAIGIDATVLGFAALISMIAAVLVGLAPALQAARADLQPVLREAGRTGGRFARRALVIGEIALALTLLAGAGLMLRSFSQLQSVNPGFVPHGTLTFTVPLPSVRYATGADRTAFHEQLLERIRSLPQVASAGATHVIPFGQGWTTASFGVEGLELAPGEPMPWGDLRYVSPGFLETLRVPLLQGRTFTEQDRAGEPLVAVVDEGLVRRYFPGEDPLGKRLSFGTDEDGNPNWITVVGVVGHTMHEALDAEARVQVYRPIAQVGAPPSMSYAVRVAGEPLSLVGPIRQILRDMDRELPMTGIATLDERVGASLGPRRLSTGLIGGFAALALLLAALGVFGIMSHLVTEQTRELGVRMALGARTPEVLGVVLRQGLGLALPGIVLGLAGALAGTRLLGSQLFGVSATDPLTHAAVALTLLATAIIATVLPARRAIRLDLVRVLKSE